MIAIFAPFAVQFALGVQHRPPKMSYIENKEIRLGVDLNMGGSITYLAPVSDKAKNVVNSADLGRQIQLSYYSGPVPYQPPGAVISQQWQGLGWNPIQSGDFYNNASKILAFENSGDHLYLKCIPMHWPLKNVPGECVCEVWLTLDHSTVKAKCRLTNNRPDHTQYLGRAQELPAVYVNAPYYHLMTYRGDEPFESRPLTEIKNRLDKEGNWTSWNATEHWAAQVDDQQWGLGIWSPVTSRFSGGFFSQPGVGGPSDSPTGYIAPNRTEILDYNIVYDYNYVLILGSLEHIRKYATDHAHQIQQPVWRFLNDRQGWSLAQDVDTGWPIRGCIDLSKLSSNGVIYSSEFATRTDRLHHLVVDLDPVTSGGTLQVQWRTSATGNFSPVKTFILSESGRRSRKFNVELPDRSVVTQLRLNLPPCRLYSVRLER